VRARYYRQEIARWMTVDPLWPDEEDFAYCRLKPTMAMDPSGLQNEETIWDKIWYILNPPPLIIPMPPDPPPWRVPPGEKIKVSPAIEELRHWCSVKNFYYPTWRFGNCCGLGLKCGPGMSNGSCIDKACEKHDVCVGPEWIQGGKNWLPCARSFCEDLKKCYKKNGCATQLTPSAECQATWESGKFFCAQVGLAFP
ncbi:MAG TPA: hypothetical protein PKA27_10320, partial [Fimbriimonadaceae bacterium]|nr:hypothetical protein [Fimbriimonadaceae bacterium]